MSVRSVVAVLSALVLTSSACASSGGTSHPYAAQTTTFGASQHILGWDMKLSNLRFDGDHVLVDVDASAADAGSHADPKDLRFGLYGALAHPIEADATVSCRDVTDLAVQPLSAPSPDRLTGTVCLGPQRDQAQVRGIYVYSPRDRQAGTTRAWPAAFPVGLPPTRDNDTGLTIKTTSLDAFRADGVMLGPASLGDPDAFTGEGYMLIGLEIDGPAMQYSDVSNAGGGPTMVLVSPTRPAPGLSHACDVYGASVLVLPDSSRDAVKVRVTLCTQGEINAALLYPTVSMIGTHAALWSTDE